MIYTITFNPSLDYVMHVDHFKVGETNRSKEEEIYPGGKGFNVSTILQRLGYENTALGYIAGFTGEAIERLLKQRDISLELMQLEEGLSRINVKMKSAKETEINGNGPIIGETQLTALLERLDQLTSEDTLILAGSIPSSLPNDIYETIMVRLANKNIRIIVDATGELLVRVLPYNPFLVKPNQDEMMEIFNVEINTTEEIIHYAKKLKELGACNVLVSCGAKGALLISEDNHVYSCNAAKGELKNSVGSGDSMVAGFLAGYLKKQDYKEALCLGSASGGATAFSEDLAIKEKIEEVYKQLTVEVIE